MELVSLAPSLDIKVLNEMNEWQVNNSSIIKIVLHCTVVIIMSGLHLGKMISSWSWREIINSVTSFPLDTKLTEANGWICFLRACKLRRGSGRCYFCVQDAWDRLHLAGFGRSALCTLSCTRRGPCCRLIIHNPLCFRGSVSGSSAPRDQWPSVRRFPRRRRGLCARGGRGHTWGQLSICVCQSC